MLFFNGKRFNYFKSDFYVIPLLNYLNVCMLSSFVCQMIFLFK